MNRPSHRRFPRQPACHRPRAPPRAWPEFTTRYPDGKGITSCTRLTRPEPTNDPFDLGAVLVIDTAAANAPRRCDTSDGCTPTCASSCTSAS